jgi:hypothetical protein
LTSFISHIEFWKFKTTSPTLQSLGSSLLVFFHSNFADALSEKARAKGLQRDDYRIKALIQNGKVMTKDHEGNIKTITLRENEALIFVEIYDDSDWRDFQKYQSHFIAPYLLCQN